LIEGELPQAIEGGDGVDIATVEERSVVESIGLVQVVNVLTR
jgi:hypothetical protein